MRPGLACVALVLAAACGDDDTTPTADGGEADAGPVVGLDIPWLAAGAPPVLAPDLLPCPDGWTELAGEPPVCEPWPATGPADCGPGEAHFPGGAGCEPLGEACPAGDFADDLPTDRPVVHVLESAAAGGDGSRASPYGDLSEFAFGGLRTGSVVALGAGRYEGVASLRNGVLLRGACAARTTLASTMPATNAGVVNVAGTGAEVRGVAIGAGPRPGIWASGAVGVRVEGVEIVGASALGVAMFDGASLTGTDLVVTGTNARADGEFGNGVSLQGGSSIDAQRIVSHDNRNAGVSATQDCTAVLGDLHIARTQSTGVGGFGRGITFQFAIRAEVRRAAVEDNRDVGIFASEDGSDLLLEDSVVRGTLGDEARDAGGRAVSLNRGPTATLRRVLLEQNRDIAIMADEAGTRLDLSDAVLRDTDYDRQDRLGGRGLSVQRGASVSAARVLLERNREFGIIVRDAAEPARLEDVVLRNTLARELDGNFGRGLSIETGTVAELSRVIIDGAHEIGLFANDPGTILTGSDIVVRNTESTLVDGFGGRGADVQLGADMELTRVLLDSNRDVGLISAGDGVGHLDHVVVRGTRERGCAETDCPLNGAGHDVGVYEGGRLTLDQFAIRDAALCGLQIATRGELDLSRGEVTGSPIGACIQVDGYDVARLTTDVSYEGNETNLETTTLPVPDASRTGLPP